MRLATGLRRRHAPRDEVLAAYSHAPLPSRRTRWREAAWCAVDLELTGLDPRRHEIISFGAVPIDRGRVRLEGAVSGLAAPDRAISEAAIRVHGIRERDLAAAAPLERAVRPLLEAVTGRILVVHVAAVERAFLGRALRAQGVRLRGPMADTSILGRIWLHERDGVSPRPLSLTETAAALGLPAERPHDALGDALTTAQVFIALATHLDSIHHETVGSLVRAGARLEALRVFSAR
jgi:DNA polymerase III subunit epsilon